MRENNDVLFCTASGPEAGAGVTAPAGTPGAGPGHCSAVVAAARSAGEAAFGASDHRKDGLGYSGLSTVGTAYWERIGTAVSSWALLQLADDFDRDAERETAHALASGSGREGLVASMAAIAYRAAANRIRAAAGDPPGARQQDVQDDGPHAGEDLPGAPGRQDRR